MLYAIRPYVREGQLVVLQSTTTPGTTEALMARALHEAMGGVVGRDFHIGYAPERVNPGDSNGWNLETTPKLVAGATPECARRTRLLFAQVCRRVVQVSSTTFAELAKVYDNTFRQVNIALANELALVCERLGVSAWEVIDAAATKPYGFLAHYPGPGLGGDCIPVDPLFLADVARAHGYDTHMIRSADTVIPEGTGPVKGLLSALTFLFGFFPWG